MGTYDKAELRIAYWLNTHREQLKKVGYGTAIGVVVFIWLIVLILVIRWVAYVPATQRALDQANQVAVVYGNVTEAVPAEIASSGAVESGEGRFDAYAVITNPNPKHAVILTYQFQSGSVTLNEENIFIAPNEERVVVHPDQLTNASPSFTITEQRYERIRGNLPVIGFAADSTTITPVNVRAAEIVENATTDVTTNTNTNSSEPEFLTPDDAKELDEAAEAAANASASAAPYSLVKTNVQNNSALGFKSVTLVTVLRDQAGTIVGVKPLQLLNFDSFDSQPVAIVWKKRFAIDVVPEFAFYTNYLDTDNVILPED